MVSTFLTLYVHITLDSISLMDSNMPDLKLGFLTQSIPILSVILVLSHPRT